jgi:hypothetical protein
MPSASSSIDFCPGTKQALPIQLLPWLQPEATKTHPREAQLHSHLHTGAAFYLPNRFLCGKQKPWMLAAKSLIKKSLKQEISTQ